MQSPPIDPRSRAELTAHLRGLAQELSGWRPAQDGRPDPGSALIGVAARFADIVIERVNRVPERNYLAFLNLIGTRPLPPQAARVPLTFTLAEGLPADVVVPAGTQAAAEPVGEDPDGHDSIVFETEQPLVVTRSKLRSIVVSDPVHDTRTDAQAAPGVAAGSFVPFDAFVGAEPVPHELYLRVEAEPLTPATSAFEVVMAADDLRHLTAVDALSWSFWDGATWTPLPGAPAVGRADPATGSAVVGVPALPAAVPCDVEGLTGIWLRARLEIALPSPRTGPPDSIMVGRRPPQDVVPGTAPFGEDAAAHWCYLDLDLPPGATGVLAVVLSQPGVADRGGITLAYSRRTAASDWEQLGTSTAAGVVTSSPGAGLTDSTAAFTRSGEVSFAVPAQWTTTVFNGRPGRWLRIAVTAGGYTTSPVLERLTVTYRWSGLPIVRGITFRQTRAVASLEPVATGLLNQLPVDLSTDVRLFGEQPRWGDTVHLAGPAAAEGSTRPLTLAVTVVNAAGKSAGVTTVSATPDLRWETFDGTVWRAATASRADAFTRDGDVVLTPAAPLVASQVTGVTAPWVRVRIVSGDYGEPTSYALQPDKTYTPVKATLAPPVVTGLAWRRPAATVVSAPSACVSRNDDGDVVHWSEAATANTAQAVPFSPFVIGGRYDPALYLGFDRPFGSGQVTLFLSIEPPTPDDVTADRLSRLDPDLAAQVQWEYSASDGWRSLAALDGTGTFGESGTVTFVGPPDQAGAACFGRDGFWLRGRWTNGDFPVPPRLRAVLANTCWAAQVTTVSQEVLGSGDATPGQRFTTSQRPVLPGQSVVVREPAPPPEAEAAALRAAEGDDAVMITLDDSGAPDEVWVRWQPVADFYASGPTDRHYTIDPLAGLIAFGDGRSGMLPPRGVGTVRVTYRTGGGPRGNRPRGSVTQLRTAVPGVDGVTNVEAAVGGAPREPIARISARGPRVLRHRDRAVTTQDLEDLAYAAASDVARARAIPPFAFDPLDLWLDLAAPQVLAKHTSTDAGQVGVIVVPDSPDVRPTPSLGLLRRVRTYLRERTPATGELWVAGPEWMGVTVTATVVPRPGVLPDGVRAAVLGALERYLHPLTGGADGLGWAFGRKPQRSDLFALVQGVPGVDHVPWLAVVHRPESADLGDRLTQALNRPLAELRAEPFALDLRRWLDRALVFSGPHDVIMTLRGTR